MTLPSCQYRKMLPLAVTLGLGALGLGTLALAAPAIAAGPTSASAILMDSAGHEAGRVKLVPSVDGLAGTIDVAGLTLGDHGMHIHAVGKCDAPGFTSAGGHLNPDGKQHGMKNPMGAHQGDLPALIVGADGTAHQSFTAHSGLSALFDTDGAAFVVHAGADDMMTDPSGNSGGRVLCGVLMPTEA